MRRGGSARQADQEASARHAPPVKACKLIGDYSNAEVKMIKYVETNASACGISPQVLDQLNTGHQTTDRLLQRVCIQARSQNQSPDGLPRINDLADPAFSRPEKRQDGVPHENRVQAFVMAARAIS
jgi:hypothetical protein